MNEVILALDHHAEIFANLFFLNKKELNNEIEIQKHTFDRHVIDDQAVQDTLKTIR